MKDEIIQAIQAIQKSNLSDSDAGKIMRLLRMLERCTSELSPEELQEARENAGLTAIQAANILLDLSKYMVMRMEFDADFKRGMMTESFEDKINDAYGLACKHEWTESVNPNTPDGPAEYHAHCRKCGHEKPRSCDL